MNRLKEFAGLLAPYKRAALAAFGAILCANLLDLAFPWAIKLVLDDVLRNHDIALLNMVCAGLIAVFCLKFVFGFLREYLFASIGERMVVALRNRLYWQLQRLSVGYRDRTPAGETVSGLIGDVDSIKNFLFGGMIDFTFSLFNILFVLIVLCILSWKLTLISIVFIPFYALTYLKYTPGLKARHGLVRRKYAELTARASEVFNGMRVVAGYGREEHEAGLFARKQGEILAAAMRSHRVAMLLWMGSEFMSSAGLALVIWLGGSMVLSGKLSAGTLMAFYAYLGMLFYPVIRMAVIGNYYQEASAALDRINGILQREPDVKEPAHPVKIERMRGEISFRGVSFAYPDGREVLSGIDLDIPPATTVALVGKSGAGKSTLVSLLLRFYQPGSGTLLVDGTDIRELELRSYRSHLAMVLQDDYLFSGSIRENIAYGRPDAPMDQIVAAARAANCEEFIAGITGGYDAAIGEGGIKLSFGQRQRVSIARAILRDPALLILDEATSGVDSETECRIVEEAYRHAMAGRTTVIIAHRLSLISAAGLIVFLRDGRIAEMGTHAGLLARDGLYAKMWREQQGERQGARG